MNFQYPIVVFDTETGGLNHKPEVRWESIGDEMGSYYKGIVTKEVSPILEIGAVKLDPRTLKEIDTFHAICGPEDGQTVNQLLESCDPIALKVNGFGEKIEELKVSKPFTYQLKKFCDWLPKCKFILGGQNVKFDIGMLNSAAKRRGIKLQLGEYGQQILELQVLSVFYFSLMDKPLSSYKLTNVAKELGISTDGAHSAMVDVRLVVDCIKEIIQGLKN